jgi:hypothetical protein
MLTLLHGLALAIACDIHSARCTCLPPAEPRTASEARKYIERADIAILGTVVRIDRAAVPADWTRRASAPSDDLSVTIVVRQRWRGTPTDTLVVHTSSHPEMCAMSFSLGASYFVLASRYDVAGTDERGGWDAWSCGQSRPAAKATRLRRLLGSPLAP